ncbi:PpiC-type peptidyl-prolyl cis-trans isomerase [Marinobacter santoriniensis NKSG1]|uniref:Periplasmic chaperone PpiD n=1 Tax=Marinobacter santoriniensis NKSG1 TaxID=1288826 RepID=M7CRE2_9GAMM|nr:SurA N-terminal domain-containing protein [Marinobacter santoriniensis]EMP55739.1 PpiC-type peptidyl-prolyl cis-trans isomerase [Marinobacter santoriniensis NKSG1]
MLQDIRDNAQGTIAKIIIVVLIVSLSIWGMDAIIGGFSGEPEVATVNGQDITEREFLRTVQIEKQRRLSQMETPDPSLLNEDQLRKDVLENLIREETLTQDAASQGLELSDSDIDALIRQMPQFQVDGKYSSERFAATVRNMGMGIAEFRNLLRKQYVVNQIRNGIVQSGLATESNASQLLQIQNQTRDFRALTIPAKAVADQVAVSDGDIQDYYDSHTSQFRQPEQVDAAYIALSVGALADSIDVSDDEVKAYYDQKKDGLAREERRAAHILINDGPDASATIAKIQDRLSNGESFADLAKEYSIDTATADKGGELGYAGRGVYDPDFEKALFGLKEGEVSEPVKTRFGVHLIKLEDIRRSKVPSFDEMKDKLRAELARKKAEDKFAEVRSKLADSAYAADDLAGPAKELGLEVREISGITRDGGPAPFDHAGLVRQLFSDDVLNAGYNTELIDVGDNLSVVARVRAHREAKQLALDAVKDQVRSTLVEQKTLEALAQRADSIIADLKQGKSADEIGAGEWVDYTDQGRNASGLPAPVLQTAFSLPRPSENQPSFGKVVDADQASVIALDAVNQGKVDKDSEEYKRLYSFLSSLEGQRDYTAYQQMLRKRAEVERP